MANLIRIYNKMLNKFSPQGWWPLSKNSLHSRHHQGPPRNDKDIFEIVVGAILTQNTAWANVEKALYQLNKHKMLDINKISNAKKEQIGKLIRSAGYYNQKAERLKTIANFLKENKIKELKKLETGKLRKLLLEIKGIGPETADSILLYAFEKPVFVVDAYTKRAFSRLGFFSESADYSKVQEMFMKSLPKETEIYKEYHALIVELCKKSCRKNPLCSSCVIKGMCPSASSAF